MSSKKLWAIIISVVIVGLIIGGLVYAINVSTKAKEIDIRDAEELVNQSFDDMAYTNAMKFVSNANYITVNSISYGSEKNVILDCTVESLDIYSALSPQFNYFLLAKADKETGNMKKSSLDFKREFEATIIDLVSGAQPMTQNCVIEIYDTHQGYKVYASKEALNSVFGGWSTVQNEMISAETYTNAKGEVINVEHKNINNGFMQCIDLRYEAEKPDTSNYIGRKWNSLKRDFNKTFVNGDNWEVLLKGLSVTLRLTFFSLIIGIVLGFLVAFVRCTYLKQRKRGIILRLINGICQLYLTVIRGTPVLVQILIMHYVVLLPLGVDRFVSAVLCFGINSGAYVAEIVRGGIMSVDEGQTEAGRSLGFGYMSTMFHIVFPQAFKAVLPALANEFVVLLKETSIAFTIGVADLMKEVNSIRAATYIQFMPLLAAALIYLVLVIILSKLVSLLERRLRKSER